MVFSASFKKAQISVELVIIGAMMMGLLLSMLVVNESLRVSWVEQKQVLEATAAANQVAMAINLAAAGGDGSQVAFENYVDRDITSITIFDKRSVRAHYISGSYVAIPLVTNNTDIPAGIPINQNIIVRNSNGRITVG